MYADLMLVLKLWVWCSAQKYPMTFAILYLQKQWACHQGRIPFPSPLVDKTYNPLHTCALTEQTPWMMYHRYGITPTVLDSCLAFFFFPYWQHDKTLSKPAFRVVSVWLASSQIFIHDLTLNMSELHIKSPTFVCSWTLVTRFWGAGTNVLLVTSIRKGDLRDIICQYNFGSIVSKSI